MIGCVVDAPRSDSSIQPWCEGKRTGQGRLCRGCDKVIQGAGEGQAGGQRHKSGAQAPSQEAEPVSISVSRVQRHGIGRTWPQMKEEDGPDSRGLGGPHQQAQCL